MSGRYESSWVCAIELRDYCYCPRAGVISIDLEGDDDGDEFEEEGLGMRSPAELRMVRRKSLISLIVFGGLAAALSAVGFGLIVYAEQVVWVPKIFLVGGGVLLLVYWIRVLVCMFRFTASVRVLRELLTLEALPVPAPNHVEPVEVSWWSMVADGFESEAVEEALRDPVLMLTGKPWRVLRKGELRVPVLRITADAIVGQPLEVKSHDRLRAMAYAVLMEEEQDEASPYALILFGRSGRCLTVPAWKTGVAEVTDQLSRFRVLLDRFDNGVPVRPPAPELCQNCSFAESYYDEIEDEEEPSQCGARFRWTPPQ